MDPKKAITSRIFANVFSITLNCFLTVFLISFWYNLGFAAEVTIAWNANTEYWLTGYNLYVKEGSSIQPDDSQAVIITIPLSSPGFNPDSPSYTVTDLKDDIVYYFIVSAYSYYGLESGFSNEVSVRNGKLHITPQSSSSGTDSGCLIDAVIP
jgi:hypothetical protein